MVLFQQESTESLLPAEFSTGSYSKKVIGVKFQALRLVEGGRRLVLVFGIQVADSEGDLMDGLVIYRNMDNTAKCKFNDYTEIAQ